MYRAMCRASKYEEVGEVSQMFFYPVKSCKAISIASAYNSNCGLVYEGLQDRCFMFCTTDGQFLSQARHPKMALIETSIPEPGVVTLRVPNMPELTLRQKSSEKREKITVKMLMYGRVMEVEDCGDEAGAWIDKYLELEGTRIVVSRPDISLKASCVQDASVPKGKTAYIQKNYVVSFQNRTPILLSTEESVEDIQDKVDKDVTAANFRVNILGKGCGAPFDEDNWVKLKIGKSEMHSMWLNERCGIVTITQDVGEFRPDQEPIRTLHSYRDIKEHKRPILGVNFGVDIEGDISVGDKIYVVRGNETV